MLGPLFKLDALSLAFWPCVLFVDLLAIGLASITGSLVAWPSCWFSRSA